jgi:tetratricopeptide (TPR) repeat protein
VTNKLLIGFAALLVVGFVAFFGGAFTEPPAQPPSALAGSQSVEDFKAGFALNASTATLVESLQATLEANRKDEHTWALLGLAYQQRARETGDPTYYTKSGGALDLALKLDPKDWLVYSGLGSLALSRHRFALALDLGEKAHALSPTTARNYGVIGDAEIELGRYREAFRTFNRMAALKPDVASYARVSYARELIGHIRASERAMQLAASAALGAQEASAWTHVQLGLLYDGHGEPAKALVQMRDAYQLDPSYYVAYDGIAQVLASEGKLRLALRWEQEAVDRVPLPAQVALLGDLYAATGHAKAAKREYALIGVIERILAAHGVRNDLDIALFDADHGLHRGTLVELARRGYAERPSIYGDDVLGWALARSGDCREALRWSNRSLRLGTQDALKFFHHGWIEACLGNHAEAAVWYRRALALNPGFSVLWAPVARAGARR